MDPLSITVAITALIGCCARATTGLIAVKNSYQSASVTVLSILSECDVMNASLSQLQLLVLQNPSSLSSRLLPDSPLATSFENALTSCTLTMSAFEYEVSRMVTGEHGKGKMGFRAKIGMVWKEDTMKELRVQIQQQQTAVTMLISTFQVEKIADLDSILRQNTRMLQSLLANAKRVSKHEHRQRGNKKVDDDGETIFSFQLSSEDGPEPIHFDEKLLAKSQAYQKRHPVMMEELWKRNQDLVAENCSLEDENAELGKQIEKRDEQLAEMVNFNKPALEELEKRSKKLENLLKDRDQLISEVNDVVIPAAEAQIDKVERRNLKLKQMIESYARSYLLTQEYVAALNHEKPENSELHKYIMNSKRFAHIREALEEDHFTDAEETPDKSSPKSPSLTWRSSSATLRDKDKDRENTPTTSERKSATASNLIRESKRMRAEDAEKGVSGGNSAQSFGTLVKKIEKISNGKEEMNSKGRQAGADKKEAAARVNMNTVTAKLDPIDGFKETLELPPQPLLNHSYSYPAINSSSQSPQSYASLTGYKRRPMFLDDDDDFKKGPSTPVFGASPLQSLPNHRTAPRPLTATAAPTEKALTNYNLDKMTNPSGSPPPRHGKAPPPPAVKLPASLRKWREKASAVKFPETNAGERTPTTSSGEGSMAAPPPPLAAPASTTATLAGPDGTTYWGGSYLTREKSAPALSPASGPETTSAAGRPPPPLLSASAPAVGNWAANGLSPVAAKTEVDLLSSSPGGTGQWGKGLRGDDYISSGGDSGGSSGGRRRLRGTGGKGATRKNTLDVRKKR